MKAVLTLILFTIYSLAFAQVDTINYRPYNTTKTETTVKTTVSKDDKIVKKKTKKKKTKYTVEDKNATKKQYENATKESSTIGDCKPCWLRYYGKDGKLLQEGLSYTDCALGKRTEYYSSGKIKVIRYYKTNDTNDWTNFPCSVAEGTWTYYKEDGTVEKLEKYKDGKIIE